MGKVLDYSTPFCREKAVAAMIAQVDKELCDALGACSWMYPWYTSPLKERGYQGDVSIFAKYWNAVSGDNKTQAQFDVEGKRFYVMQRCETMKRMKTYDMRTPTTCRRRVAREPGGNGNTYEYWYTNWDTLSTYYEVWGFDPGHGCSYPRDPDRSRHSGSRRRAARSVPGRSARSGLVRS